MKPVEITGGQWALLPRPNFYLGICQTGTAAFSLLHRWAATSRGGKLVDCAADVRNCRLGALKLRPGSGRLTSPVLKWWFDPVPARCWCSLCSHVQNIVSTLKSNQNCACLGMRYAAKRNFSGSAVSPSLRDLWFCLYFSHLPSYIFMNGMLVLIYDCLCLC